MFGKALFDGFFALCAIAVTSPLWFFATVGILLSSPGPVFYKARRVGKGGQIFIMHKFRTMHWQPANEGAVITGHRDARIFHFGAFLRKTKIDELPQFWDVLCGKLSVVGPRPEDPKIVEEHYTDWMKETLSVKPGITSPGALWGYTKSEAMLTGGEPEKAYIEKVLPYKLALEYVYVKKASFFYDLELVARTALTVIGLLLGRQNFSELPEAKEIPVLLHDHADKIVL